MGISLLAVWHALRGLAQSRASRLTAVHAGERGDVPGWVLITLMTAGIVTALWVVAEPALSNLLTSALSISGDPNK